MGQSIIAHPVCWLIVWEFGSILVPHSFSPAYEKCFEKGPLVRSILEIVVVIALHINKVVDHDDR